MLKISKMQENTAVIFVPLVSDGEVTRRLETCQHSFFSVDLMWMYILTTLYEMKLSLEGISNP